MENMVPCQMTHDTPTPATGYTENHVAICVYHVRLMALDIAEPI